MHIYFPSMRALQTTKLMYYRTTLCSLYMRAVHTAMWRDSTSTGLLWICDPDYSICVLYSLYQKYFSRYSRHCPILNFFRTFKAVLNGLLKATLEDGFKTRIIFLFPLCTCAVFVWALHWRNDICCAYLTPSAFLCMLVKWNLLCESLSRHISGESVT